MVKQNTCIFTCFIVSEDLIACDFTDILLENGIEVLGLISPLDEVREFARQKNIYCFKTLTDAEAILLRTKYDFLYSIINSKIIPPLIIDNAQVMSINYHNALLPKYGHSWRASKLWVFVSTA